jgi:hypothetical protein
MSELLAGIWFVHKIFEQIAVLKNIRKGIRIAVLECPLGSASAEAGAH